MRALIVGALVAAALAAAGCGGDDDTGNAGSTPATSTAPAATTTATTTATTSATTGTDTGGEAVTDEGDRQLILQEGATAKAMGKALDRRQACRRGDSRCFLNATERIGDVAEQELPKLRAAIRGATTPCLRRGGDYFAQALRAWMRSRDAAAAAAFNRASNQNVLASGLLHKSNNTC